MLFIFVYVITPAVEGNVSDHGNIIILVCGVPLVSSQNASKGSSTTPFKLSSLPFPNGG